jgi:hypothetical protein
MDKLFLRNFKEFRLLKSSPHPSSCLLNNHDSKDNVSANGTDDYLYFDTPNELLHHGSLNANLPLILYALALDADRNALIDNQTPLIKTVLSVIIRLIGESAM